MWKWSRKMWNYHVIIMWKFRALRDNFHVTMWLFQVFMSSIRKQTNTVSCLCELMNFKLGLRHGETLSLFTTIDGINMRTLRRILRCIESYRRKNESNITDAASFLIDQLERHARPHGYYSRHVMLWLKEQKDTLLKNHEKRDNRRVMTWTFSMLKLVTLTK